MIPSGDLWRIVGRRFVAGVIARKGRIVFCAPIVRWALGWNLVKLQRHATERGWGLKKVET